MPLLQHWLVNSAAQAAIWHVTEPEHFFVEATGLQSTIAAEKRRIEHLAGRYLLQLLVPGIALQAIAADEQGKPRVPGNEVFFSISHSFPHVAVMVHPHSETGIDIQAPRSNIEKIKNKFLSLAEQELLGHDPARFLLAWCAKEAVYKWNARREVAFIEQMPIIAHSEADITIHMPLHEQLPTVTVGHSITASYTCAWVQEVNYPNLKQLNKM